MVFFGPPEYEYLRQRIDASFRMRHDCLRAAAVAVRRYLLWHHREGLGRARSLRHHVGITRLGAALIHMGILRHAGNGEERRNEGYSEDVFHCHDSFGWFERALSALSFMSSKQEAGGLQSAPRNDRLAWFCYLVAKRRTV